MATWIFHLSNLLNHHWIIYFLYSTIYYYTPSSTDTTQSVVRTIFIFWHIHIFFALHCLCIFAYLHFCNIFYIFYICVFLAYVHKQIIFCNLCKYARGIDITTTAWVVFSLLLTPPHTPVEYTAKCTLTIWSFRSPAQHSPTCTGMQQLEAQSQPINNLFKVSIFKSVNVFQSYQISVLHLTRHEKTCKQDHYLRFRQFNYELTTVICGTALSWCRSPQFHIARNQKNDFVADIFVWSNASCGWLSTLLMSAYNTDPLFSLNISSITD